MAGVWDATRGIIGIGYEGLTAEQLVGKVADWGVTVVVDVRLNPISRKKGLSKRALAEALGEAGIGYLHLPALGNPRDNRSGYAELPADDNQSREQFRSILETEPAQAALRQVAEIASREHVAVLCFEESELHCHRREVLAAVRPLLDELVAV